MNTLNCNNWVRPVIKRRVHAMLGIDMSDNIICKMDNDFVDALLRNVHNMLDQLGEKSLLYDRKQMSMTDSHIIQLIDTIIAPIVMSSQDCVHVTRFDM